MKKITVLISIILVGSLISGCGNKRKTSKSMNVEVPIVTIAPNYPRPTAIAKVEGWVEIQFTVTKQGTVESPIVLKSYPAGVFDREAIRALLKYKFKPWKEKGKVIEHQMVQIIEFKLAK